MKKIALLLTLIVLTGCGLTPERQEQRLNAIAECRARGGTPDVGSFNYITECYTPDEMRKKEHLELACVESGGNPITRNGFYTSCGPRQAVAPAVAFEWEDQCITDFVVHPCKYPPAAKQNNATPPAGSKSCTYKSGSRVWIETVTGYVCPVSSSRGGILGTVQR